MSEEYEEEESLIRKEWSNIPLGEIQELRKKVGIKKFNSIMSISATMNHHTESSCSGTTQQFKRLNKHRPREMSSKKPVSRFRQVVEVRKKEERRDPRFDERCGHLNQDLFSKSFEFLKEMKEKETAEMERNMRKTKDSRRKERLQRILKKAEESKWNREKAEESKALEKEHRKMELELRKQGRKPFYLSKALKHKVLLAQKYKELKKSGKLSKFLVKKRKKNASRDRKRLPQ